MPVPSSGSPVASPTPWKEPVCSAKCSRTGCPCRWTKRPSTSRCDGALGDPLSGGATTVADPLITVEVGSRSTAALDAGEKLAGYMGIPTLWHSLIVAIKNRAVIHHAGAGDGSIATRIAREFPLRLDPPGIDLADPFACPPGRPHLPCRSLARSREG